MTDLLGPGDPPPFEVVNESGAAPLLLVCDHAGKAVPKSLDRLGLDDSQLSLHIGWDIGAVGVARRLSRALDAPLVLSTYSRLVIDCNRPPCNKTSIPAESDGVDVPGNARIDEHQADRRRREIFEPYHRAIEALVKKRLDAGRPFAFLSVHSFTPEMQGVRRPWHVGVLWDKDDRFARALMDALGADPTLVVGDNEPYSARGRAGYGLHVHAVDRGVPGALIEIRQDLIETESGEGAWAAKLVALWPRVLERAGV